MGYIVGIDLGTTNSCVAIIKDGRPKVIEDERGYNILPSCVAMKGKGRFVVGHAAKALILTQPQDVLYAVKRLIGKKFHAPEVQETLKRVAYEVVEGENGGVLLRMGDLEITPVEASSIILKAVKEIAERAVGEPIADAVISVPAHFSHAQRKATMDAGEKAGLNVLRLLNEPTAAALAYGFKKDIQKKIAVFDLGGGTFDVSILEVGDGVYEILGTAGNTFLGGEDFDFRIVTWLADTFRSRTGIEVRNDRESLQRLRDAAERAKCELSFVDRTPILIPHLHGDHNLEVELSREQLEAMVQDLINETIKITDSALRTANVSIEHLDEIILVGGMTRMPKIQETIKIFFGMNPCKGVHPEEVVAVGGAVHGFSLESETQNTLLLDVTPMGLGIDVAGGFFKPIIEKNTTVPCSESRTFTTVRDGQKDVKVIVRQGESKLAPENELLGEFTLSGVRDAEKMVPRIDVTFRVDSNGILQVTAVDRDTGESQQISIKDYIEQATGQERKDVQLARDELRHAGKDEEPTRDAVKEGIFGRMASKLAGFGRKKKKEEAPEVVAAARRDQAAPEPEPKDPHAIQARADERASVVPRREDRTAIQPRGAAMPDLPIYDDPPELLEPLAVQPRESRGPDRRPAVFDADPDVADELRRSMGAAPAPVRPPEDPFALTERPAGTRKGAARPMTAVLDDLEDSLMEAPLDPMFDAFGVAPRPAPGSGKGGATSGRPGIAAPPQLLDLDGLDMDDLDLFAISPRPGEPALPTPASVRGGPTDDRTEPSRDKKPLRNELVENESEEQTSPSISAKKAAASVGPTRPMPSPKAAAPPPVAPPPVDDDDEDDGTPVSEGRGKRRPARLRISYKKASTFVGEYRRNLQRGGTFIKTRKPLDVGRDCVLHLTVPGFDAPIEVQGTVVWSSKGQQIGPGQDEGMGIKYDPADAGGMLSLKNAVDHLAAST